MTSKCKHSFSYSVQTCCMSDDAFIYLTLNLPCDLFNAWFKEIISHGLTVSKLQYPPIKVFLENCILDVKDSNCPHVVGLQCITILKWVHHKFFHGILWNFRNNSYPNIVVCSRNNLITKTIHKKDLWLVRNHKKGKQRRISGKKGNSYITKNI